MQILQDTGNGNVSLSLGNFNQWRTENNVDPFAREDHVEPKLPFNLIELHTHQEMYYFLPFCMMNNAL